MHRSKLYREIVFVILAVMGIGFVFRLWAGEKDTEPYEVSVIVDDSNNDRWIALKQGLEQAAIDFGVKLNIVSTDEFKEEEEELAVLRRELGNGVDGIVVQMISSEGVGEELETVSSAAIVLLETDIIPEEYYASVVSDNPGIGRTIAECIVDDFDGNISDMRIGILSGNQRQLALQQRLEAFTECIEESGGRIVWELDGESAEQFEEIIAEQPVNIVVALENTETERAVDHLENREEGRGKYMLYGEGISEKAVYYLDKGTIQWLVVPNEYYMGYKSVAGIAQQLQHVPEEEQRSQADYLVVNKDNMYDENNQKILFPIVQ